MGGLLAEKKIERKAIPTVLTINTTTNKVTDKHPKRTGLGCSLLIDCFCYQCPAATFL